MSDSINVSVLIEEYITLRDTLSAEKKEFDRLKASIDTRMDEIELDIRKLCDLTGSDSFKCPAGTAFKTTTRQVSVSGDDGFEKLFTYAKQHDMPHLLTKKPSKNAVLELLEHDSNLTPEMLGIEVFSESVIQIRR